MARSAVAIALLLAALVPLAAPPVAEAQGGVGFTVNVVSARSLGCSPDRITEPDLRVRVLLDGVEAVVTPEASDRRAPLFAVRSDFTRALPVRVSVEVQEGEPGGFLFLGTTWVPCDTAEGPGTWHNFTYEGGAAERIVARGDGNAAAEAVVVLGRNAPPPPVVRVVDAAPGSARLEWDPPPSNASQTSHRVARAGTGEEVASVPAGVLAANLTGLCDATSYLLRVVRDQGPWSVASTDVNVTTPNGPPAAARVVRVDVSPRNLTVEWESRTLHDVDRFEVHVGAKESFTPGAGSLRRSAAPVGSFGDQPAVSVARHEGDAYVKVVTVDKGGLFNVSLPFTVGAPAQTKTIPPPSDPCTGVVVEPPPAPPTPATTTGGTPPAGTTPAGPDAGGPTTLLPEDDGGDVGAASDDEEGLLEGGSGLLLLLAVGLVGVAVGALAVLLLNRR